MTKIVKDGAVMVARDGNQLAAFLNNGWKASDENKIADNQNKNELESIEFARKYTK